MPLHRMVAGMCMMSWAGRPLRCAHTNHFRHAGLVGQFVEGALSQNGAHSEERATSFIPFIRPVGETLSP